MSSEKQTCDENGRPDVASPITSSARNSIDTISTVQDSADPEKLRENVRRENPNGFSRTESGINVTASEAEFATLQWQLSGISQTSRRIARSKSRESARKGKGVDVEKAATSESSSDDEVFDLESTLRGAQAADIESGIRPKHIGVVWEGLTVTGQGGVTNFVKTFPDAFVSFFNVVETAMNIFGLGKKGKNVDILKDFRGVVKPGEMVGILALGFLAVANTSCRYWC